MSKQRQLRVAKEEEEARQRALFVFLIGTLRLFPMISLGSAELGAAALGAVGGAPLLAQTPPFKLITSKKKFPFRRNVIFHSVFSTSVGARKKPIL